MLYRSKQGMDDNFAIALLSEGGKIRFMHVIRIIIDYFILFLGSFALNFIWEAMHGVYLYQGHDMKASQYVPMVVYVSFMDGCLILGISVFVSLLRRDLLWLKNPEKYGLFLFGLTAMLLSGFIEHRAVYNTYRWAYRPEMPTLFGIGLSPLLQLAVTGGFSIFLVNCISQWGGREE